jgi:hypothetical protein
VAYMSAGPPPHEYRYPQSFHDFRLRGARLERIVRMKGNASITVRRHPNSECNQLLRFSIEGPRARGGVMECGEGLHGPWLTRPESSETSLDLAQLLRIRQCTRLFHDLLLRNDAMHAL